MESKTDKPAPKDDKDALKSLPMPELMKKLGSSADGLTQAEAQKLLVQYGPNAIEEKKTNIILKFLSYFWGPIPWMIEGAVILSGVVRHWMDFSIILFLLFSNAVVGGLLGRTPGGQCHRRPEETPGSQCARKARWKVDRT
jgi:H+-transporting ATPase